MAMKALRCPQCNAELELDDEKEFGFCTHCGTKVMLHDVVEYTGSVALDTSAQGRNRILLGNRAFEAGNWKEAYDCFTRALADLPDDVTALYPDETMVAQNYLFFCAKEPESGELYFSRTLAEHERAVNAYRSSWEQYDQSRGIE